MSSDTSPGTSTQHSEAARPGATPSAFRKWRLRFADRVRYHLFYIKPVVALVGCVTATVAIHHYLVRRKYGPNQPTNWLDFLRRRRDRQLDPERQELLDSYMAHMTPPKSTVAQMAKDSLSDLINLDRSLENVDARGDLTKVFEFLERPLALRGAEGDGGEK